MSKSSAIDAYPDPDIVYESGPVIVVNKPGGLLTQAPSGIDSMELRLKRFLLRREDRTDNIYLAPIHRLDRPVCGLLMFARNVRAAQRISGQLERREVLKTYWAIVEGLVSPTMGKWTDFMRKIRGEARSEIVPAEHADAQFAALSYAELTQNGKLSLLEIELETGRTHQIRLQAASRGHPIVGDELYGAKLSFGPATEDLRLRWIGLMARRLRLRHPMSDEMIDVIAPLPTPWREFESLTIGDR